MKTQNKLFFSIAVLLSIGATSCGPRPLPQNSSNADSGPVEVSSGEEAEEGGDYEDIDFHGKLRVYYHNDAGNYATKRIWAWNKQVDGDEYAFDNQTSPDAFGVYKDFDLSQGEWGKAVSTTFSFIIKEVGTWRDQSTDTVCPFGKFAVNLDEATNMMTIYACEGEGTNIDTFAVREQALGDRLSAAYFSSWRTLHVEGSGTKGDRADEEVGKVASYKLYAFDAEYEAMGVEAKAAAKSRYLIKEGQPNSKSFDIALDEDVKPYLSYNIETIMAADTSRTKSKIASFAHLFDSPEFVEKYTYSGKDLGVTIDEGGATFKLWAPTSSRVQLKLYGTGVPGDLLPEFDPSANWGKTIDMKYGDHGVWQIRNEDYDFSSEPEDPYYYTYIVTNSSGTNETIDPYAKAAGVNGVRGAIIDFNTLPAPSNWSHIKSGDLLTDIARPNELSVYEAHIRDLTADETWTGTSRRGTYNAFVEEGTTYSNVATGFDHIKDLGVKAIQLLPVFDYDNDERWKDEKGNLVINRSDWGKEKIAPAYNWGYNPLNYNCIEGAYSSNPYNAATRIQEFRNLVSKAADNDMRIIMDVVYNHFASINGNPLQKVVPGYYLRTDSTGNYYDGTGCGNVTASERIMFHRFVVDSVCHWAKNFNIKGFRFDLMGCLDTATMRDVKDALYEIDPDIVVYGEGWAGLGDGGFYDVVSKKYPNLKPANTGNIYTELYDKGKGAVGGFNDCFRDSLKGNTKYGDITPEWGYISKGPNDLNNSIKKGVGEGILGGNVWQSGDSSGRTNNEQSVNYAACHDNYGLYDQLNYCIAGQDTADVDKETDEVYKATVAVSAAALLNQGIGFINGGDEIFRQKVMKPGDAMWDKMEDSIIGYSEDHKWVEGDGIKMSSGNYLVRNSYQYGDDVNSFKWDRKAKFIGYYNQIKAASLLRNELMGDVFGRSFTEISDRGVNNVFNSTYSTESNPLVACYLGGKNGDHYYLAFGGRSDTEWSDLDCGNCHIDVVYSSNEGSSYGAHTKGQSFDITNGKLGAGKFEYLLVKKS